MLRYTSTQENISLCKQIALLMLTMSRKRLVERKLACETIHNVSVSKVGQVILKKNPQEARVLIEKLEGLETHKRRWKNEFFGKVYNAREEFRQTRITSFVRSSSASKGTKKGMTTNFNQPQRVSTARKTKGRTRLYKQPDEKQETEATLNRKEPSQDTAKTVNVPKTTLKKKTLATDVKIFLNDKLMNAESGLETVTEVEKERKKRLDYMYSGMTGLNRSYRTPPSDVSQSGKRCLTCALVVAKTKLDTPQRERSNQDAVQEITNSNNKEDSQSKAVRQGSGHPRSRMSIKKISDSALTRPCFVLSPSNPFDAQKYAHIWKARVGEIVCKRRAVSGILKREKVTNLLRKNSELSSPSFLPSPVKDTRFLGLQSLLVPVTNNVGAYDRKAERF